MPLQSIRRFMHHEAAGGICLMICAALALLCANMPILRDLYASLSHPFIHVVVNDGLMTLFFLLVGLELKREALSGDLDRSRMAQPLCAALGGMAVPVLLYLVCTGFASEYRSGWAIPAATDIAFALGVAILPGGRLPSAIKILLLAIAILDDLGAILIIALFYGHDFMPLWLGLAVAGSCGLLFLNRMRIGIIFPYILCGAVIWVGLFKGGLHPTLAGVITAFALPYTKATKGFRPSPLSRCETSLHPFVIFGVLPVFAFVNAGLSFTMVTKETWSHPVMIGVLIGLLIGKPLGILGGLWLGQTLRITSPVFTPGTTRSYVAMSILCSIGFTMSLFINDLAFADADLRNPAKLGVLVASLLAAVFSRFIMRRLMKS